MKLLRYGLAMTACLAALWGAARVVVPSGGFATMKSNLRAVAAPPRAPAMRRYLPILR